MMDFTSRWDDTIGLFLLAPGARGHSLDCFGRTDLHPLPDSVSFMTYAAQMGRLAEIDSQRILQHIRECQFTDNNRRGLIKWFLEDRDNTDKNGPFFICVGLIPLSVGERVKMADSEHLNVMDSVHGRDGATP